MKSKSAVNVLNGVIRAGIITILLTVVLALIMCFIEFSVKASNVSYVVVTCISLVIGATYASRSNGEKGWLIGLLVALGYYLLLLLISSIFNKGIDLSVFDGYKLIIAMVVGLLSGMLGINI